MLLSKSKNDAVRFTMEQIRFDLPREQFPHGEGGGGVRGCSLATRPAQMLQWEAVI
jgi:hypothetical protein